MSNVERISNLVQVVNKLEPDFNALARVHGAVNFKREASFAMQILKENGYLMGVAMENQDSLRMAIINVASIGLTLSPLKSLAYLVPRSNKGVRKVTLVISYRGHVHLAAECGAIKWAKAEIVHKRDGFKLRGVGKTPFHDFDPFTDRGPIVGVYCVAKTRGDEYLVDFMTIDEVYKIRERSESWKAFKKDSSKQGPWNTDESEMIKKTMILRARKMWPMVDSHERIEKSLEVAAEAEPLAIGPAIDNNTAERIQAVAKINELLHVLDRPLEKFIEHCTRAYRRKITSIDDLTDMELQQALLMLTEFAEKQSKKGKK